MRRPSLKRRNQPNRKRRLLFWMLLVILGGISGFVLLQRHKISSWRIDDTRYAAEIRTAAARHRIPPELVRAVIYRESGFNPNAAGKAGEVGLMQVLPRGSVADWCRINRLPEPSLRQLRRPEVNLEIGCFYLARALRRWEGYRCQTELALCQYNAGERRAAKWRPEDPEDPEILSRIGIRSTREYVAFIMARYRKYLEESKQGADQ